MDRIGIVAKAHAPAAIESDTTDAVSCGRRPPGQRKAPASRGEPYW